MITICGPAAVTSDQESLRAAAHPVLLRRPVDRGGQRLLLANSRACSPQPKIYNLDMTRKFSKQVPVDIAADGRQRAFLLPEPEGLTSTYFVKLTLADASGKPVSSNFYWLSTKPDTLGEPKENSSWYYRPTEQFADFTALKTLEPVDLNVSVQSERRGQQEITRVTVENPGKTLAFFVRLKVNQGNGDGDPAGDLGRQLFLPVARRETRDRRQLCRRPMAPPDRSSNFKVGTRGRKWSRVIDEGDPLMNVATLIVLVVLGQAQNPWAMRPHSWRNSAPRATPSVKRPSLWRTSAPRLCPRSPCCSRPRTPRSVCGQGH